MLDWRRWIGSGLEFVFLYRQVLYLNHLINLHLVLRRCEVREVIVELTVGADFLMERFPFFEFLVELFNVLLVKLYLSVSFIQLDL